MLQENKPITRRRFVQSSAAAIAVPTVISASALGLDGATAPSDRIMLGVVGLGARAAQLISEFLGLADAQIVSICDVDSMHYRDRVGARDLPTDESRLKRESSGTTQVRSPERNTQGSKLLATFARSARATISTPSSSELPITGMRSVGSLTK